jgi:arabinogalactan oligomer/maltooligosaccharide transport system permease protein
VTIRTPSQRRRFAAGLAAALLVGVAGSWALVRAELGATTDDVRARVAIVSTLALADLVGRAGGAGPGVRVTLAAWQAAQPPGGDARVVTFQGISLEASTAANDVGERAAPRRLERDEKALFDEGQRLRADVAGNREGRSSKPELGVEPLGGGRLRVSVPLEAGGEVTGLLQTTSAPAVATTTPGLVTPIAAALLALAAFLALARLLDERRWPLAGLAVALLAAALLAAGLSATRSVERARRAAHAEVAAFARAQATLSLGLVTRLSLPSGPASSPAAWDADPFRRPRGFMTRDGALDAPRVDADAAAAGRAVAQGLLAAGIAAALALAAVGLGGVARMGRALVLHRQAYAYVAPAMIGTLVLVFFPFFYGVALSFTSSNIYNQSAPLTEIWVGLRNYAEILGDFGVARRGADGSLSFNYLNFYWTLLFTIGWTLTNVTIGVTSGLLLALVLNTKGLALRPIYRVILILPWAIPNYITALVWKGMFHRQFGVVNQALAIVGVEPISWFDSPLTSFLTALTTNAWLSFPFMMVVSLGALQSIPADLYEAARVDGATRWQQFRAITLPSLKPALVPAVILSVIWTFNMFNVIYLVTAGAPDGATEILVTQAYKFAFEKYQYGYAAAYATVIFGILLAYGTLQNRITRATEGI